VHRFGGQIRAAAQGLRRADEVDRLDYGGTRVTRPALAEVRVLVRARSSIAVDRRFALNGQAVRFRGRLVRGPIPDGGKLIDLQAFYRGQWRTFATPRTDPRGRWSYDYRFEAMRGVVTYRFRARPPRGGLSL
jgi:hypothetical protein